MPTRVALTCRRPPTMSANGTIEPRTITQSTSAQTGRCQDDEAALRATPSARRGARGSSTTAARPSRRPSRRGSPTPSARSGRGARPRARRAAGTRRRSRRRSARRRRRARRARRRCQSSTISARPASESASAAQIRRADVLVAERARPDRDEQRPEVLDEQRDPDREPVDREEVEELHERDAADAEDARAAAARGDRRAATPASGRAR